MTQTPDPAKPTPPPEGDDDRVSKLIDAVVGDGDTAASDADHPAADDGETPTPTDSAGEDATPEGKGKDQSKSKEKGNDKDEPEFNTFAGYLWHKWIKPVGSVFLIVAILRSTIIDWNDVPSGSMEPTIVVGDRILVNKMAYALQVPLSGPKIGVPFTTWQWDNPLDGLPSWKWGKPVRGDIVTFWNPATGVRMVKRIVAQPGDTLELRGGVMTITPADGSPTTATYTDTTPFPANTTIVRKDKEGNDVERQTEDREETILGETRSIQHIRRRWIESWGLLRLPDGSEVFAADGIVARDARNQALDVKPHQEDTGTYYRIEGEGVPLSRIQPNPDAGFTLLAIQGGAPFINGESVSYNAFAQAYLEPIAKQGPVDFNGTMIGVQGHEWTVDGEVVSSEAVRVAMAEAGFGGDTPQTLTPAHQQLLARYNLLHTLMLSSFGPVTIDDDAYYMIGDNRNNSTDSRYFGPVQRSEITGEAIAIPASFHGRIRDLDPNWSRWFHGLD